MYWSCSSPPCTFWPCSQFFSQWLGAHRVVSSQEVKRKFSSRTDRAEIARELTVAGGVPPHPNIVRYICGWQEQRKLHLQLELCEGGNLDGLLRSSLMCPDGRLLDEAVLWLILWCVSETHRVFLAQCSSCACAYVDLSVAILQPRWPCRDAASGLAHLHAHGVVHMDIKPENLYVHGSGSLKIGDLGIAVALAAPTGWQDGDGRYLAPEVLARSGGPSPAADVFSLGVSLLQCATGMICFYHKYVQAVLGDHDPSQRLWVLIK
jgi:serine/threonine protein kinase